jgi:threonylcarbamoyladenosine tRNA methylthiotransferase MtaB
MLFEANAKDGLMEGYTDNYIKIQAPFNPLWVKQYHGMGPLTR